MQYITVWVIYGELGGWVGLLSLFRLLCVYVCSQRKSFHNPFLYLNCSATLCNYSTLLCSCAACCSPFRLFACLSACQVIVLLTQCFFFFSSGVIGRGRMEGGEKWKEKYRLYLAVPECIAVVTGQIGTSRFPAKNCIFFIKMVVFPVF